MRKINWLTISEVILVCLLFSLVFSCTDPLTQYDYTIDPQLNEDSSGYFHLTMNPNSWQTIHRFTGTILEEGKPLVNSRVTWESDFYWVLSDTAGYVIDYAYTDDLVYVAIDTSYIYFGQEQFLVPIINPVSLTNSKGEFNTMFAPVRSLLGDTVSVYVNVLGDGVNFNVVLD